MRRDAGGTAESAPPGSTPVEPPARRRDIQGLRALAILLVLAFHAEVSAVSGGFIGVDVFFVISGFVITSMLHRESLGTGRIALGAFYQRRVRRILPALAVLTTATMVLAPAAGALSALRRTLGTGIAASLFSANVYLVTLGKGGYFDAPAGANPLLHTWSLSLEEQFYFVFPALLLAGVVLARRRRFRSAPAIVVTTICVVSFGLCWAATSSRLGTRLGPDFAFFMAPTRVWQFGVGSAVALAAPRIRFRPIAAEVCSWIGAIVVIWVATTFDTTTEFPGLNAALPTFGAALLVVGGTAGHTTVSRLLASRPMNWIGDRSYSWYLWHWPFVVFGKSLLDDPSVGVLVAATALSLAPAVASHRFVEEPLRRGGGGPGRAGRVAAVCILVPTIVGFALLPVGRAVEQVDAVASFLHETRVHADVDRACNMSRVAIPDPRCTWTASEHPGSATSVLVGDSNAGQFSEPFIGAANRSGRDAIVHTRGSCPFAALEVRNNHVRDAGCRRFVDRTIAAILRARPEVVVISTASDRYVEDPAIELAEIGGPGTTSPRAKEALWQRGFAEVVRRLTDAGIHVVVVMPIPKFRGWDPQQCAAIRIALDGPGCATTSDTDQLRDQRARAVRAQRAAAAEAGAAASVVDPFDRLCPSTRCATFRDDRWWWRDGNHISVGAAESLADLFDAAFASVA